MKRTWPLLLLLATAVPVMAGDMYEWTDANGVRHFSDSPPPGGVKGKRITVKGGITSNEPVEQQDAASANDGPALAAAAGYAPEDIKRNCDIARANLASAEGQRLPLDSDGYPLDLDAAKARQSQIDKANQQIKLFCSN